MGMQNIIIISASSSLSIWIFDFWILNWVSSRVTSWKQEFFDELLTNFSFGGWGANGVPMGYTKYPKIFKTLFFWSSAIFSYNLPSKSPQNTLIALKTSQKSNACSKKIPWLYFSVNDLKHFETSYQAWKKYFFVHFANIKFKISHWFNFHITLQIQYLLVISQMHMKYSPVIKFHVCLLFARCFRTYDKKNKLYKWIETRADKGFWRKNYNGTRM